MFVANALRPFAIFNGACLLRHAQRGHLGMACLVVVVGAYGQIHDALLPPASPWSDLHLGFGALLLCTIALRLRAAMRHFAVTPAADLRSSTRQLARPVYFLLYALAGLRELADISVYLGHGGTFDLGWIVVGNHGVGSPPMLPTMESFQVYVGYGLVAIVAIRIEAGSFRHRV
jgi:cytochrome b561